VNHPINAEIKGIRNSHLFIVAWVILIDDVLNIQMSIFYPYSTHLGFEMFYLIKQKFLLSLRGIFKGE
jgi:hypothetical protein